MRFEGTYVAMVTPFDKNEQIDEEGFRNSSAAMFAFTCQFSGITMSMMTVDFSERAPSE